MDTLPPDCERPVGLAGTIHIVEEDDESDDESESTAEWGVQALTEAAGITLHLLGTHVTTRAREPVRICRARTRRNKHRCPSAVKIYPSLYTLSRAGHRGRQCCSSL
jgi:hypothetical protein